MRLVFGILVLAAVGLPQSLFAQTPRTGTSVIQASSNSLAAPPYQIFPAPDRDSAAMEFRQTAQLLFSTSFRTDLGQHVLLGPETPATVSSDDRSFAEAARAKTAFRPASRTGKPPMRLWGSLVILGHGAAVFDAWSTRDVIQNRGSHELNPLFRPFASSNLIYAATQVGPGLFDYLGYRMMKSKRSWARKLWWLPQVVGTAASLFSGAHNLSVAQRRSGTPTP